MKSPRFVLAFALLLMHAHNGRTEEKMDDDDKDLLEASDDDPDTVKARAIQSVAIAQPSAINYLPGFLPSVAYPPPPPLPQQVLVPQQPRPLPQLPVVVVKPNYHVPHVQTHYIPRTTTSGPPAEDHEDGETEAEEDKRKSAQRDYFPRPNMVQLLEQEEATTLLSLLERAGLLEELQSRKATVTLFAPTNAAFSKLDSKTTQALGEDKELLESVMRYHIVPGGKLFTGVIKDDLVVPTMLDGRSLRLNKVDRSGESVVTVNGIELSSDERVDQRASNGVVHFLDEVIYPVPSGSILAALNDDNRFVTFVRAIDIANLTHVLDGSDEDESVTVFAPTDAAFDLIAKNTLNELLEDEDALSTLLLGHMVSGTKLSPALTAADLTTLADTSLKVRTRKGKVLLNGSAAIVDGDVIATNGAIQIIDHVLL